MTQPVTLIGDGIENPWNARTMQHAAAMFGGACIFRDRAKLAAAWHYAGMEGTLAIVTPDAVAQTHARLSRSILSTTQRASMASVCRPWNRPR